MIAQQQSIVESYNLNQQLYAISTYENSTEHYTAVAVGCKSTLYILKLRPTGFNVVTDPANPKMPAVTTPAIIIQLSVDVITDVCWSPNAVNDGKIALSFTNGSVCVISVNIDSGRHTFNKTNYKKEWESNPTDFTRSVNKVTWQSQNSASNLSPLTGLRASVGHYKLLCACQDGSIKLYDLKKCLSSQQPSNQADSVLNPNPISNATTGLPDIMTYSLVGAEGCRDVKFSSLQPHLFASVYENGMLAIWSCLDTGDHAAHTLSGTGVGNLNSSGNVSLNSNAVHKPRCKIGAHTKAIMSLDWHPTAPNILATAGKDSDVSGVFKIWNVRDLATDHPSMVQLHQVSCTTPINKILWRCNSKLRPTPLFGNNSSNIYTGTSNATSLNANPNSGFNFNSATTSSNNSNNSSNNNADETDHSETEYIKFTHHIATSNSGSMGAGSSISLWDVTRPHVPIVVLKGTTVTPTGAGAAGLGPGTGGSGSGGGAGAAGDSSDVKPSVILGFEWLDTPAPLHTSPGTTGSGAIDTRDRGDSSSSTMRNRPQVQLLTRKTNAISLSALPTPLASLSAAGGKAPPRQPMNVYQHIIAFTKEGTLLVYDLRNGYFPRQHMSTAVTAVSCLGTVASHCGRICKENIFSFTSNAETKAAAGFYADHPDKFGMPIEAPSADAKASASASGGAILVAASSSMISSSMITSKDAAAVSAASAAAALHSLSSATKAYLVFVADWKSSIALRFNMEVARRYICDGTSRSQQESSGSGEVEILVSLAPKLPRRKFNNGFHYGASRQRNNDNSSTLLKPMLQDISSKVTTTSGIPVRAKYSSGNGIDTGGVSIVGSTGVTDVAGTTSDAHALTSSGINIGANYSLISSSQVKSILEYEPSSSGDPFQPTTITLFAKYYRTGTLSMGHGKSNRARDVDLAVEMCKWNYSVAMSVNCHSRAQVWSSLILMLPMLAAQCDTMGVGSGSISADKTRNYGMSSNSKNLSVSDTATSIKSVAGTGAGTGFGVLPFVAPTLQQLLSELLEEGDVQHTVCCWEIFKACGLAAILTPNSSTDRSISGSNSATGPLGSPNGAVTSSASLSSGAVTPATAVAVAAAKSTPSNTAVVTTSTAGPTGSATWATSAAIGSSTTSAPTSSSSSAFSSMPTPQVITSTTPILPIPTSALTAAAPIMSELRLREAYIAYVDLLQKLGMYAEANVYIKLSKDKYFADMSKSGTTYDTSCGTCNKEIVQLNNSSNMPAWCQKCSTNVAQCCICQKLIKGLMHWCPVCSHNGHYDCYKQWFASGQTYCPTGCGHQCCIAPY